MIPIRAVASLDVAADQVFGRRVLLAESQDSGLADHARHAELEGSRIEPLDDRSQRQCDASLQVGQAIVGSADVVVGDVGGCEIGYELLRRGDLGCNCHVLTRANVAFDAELPAIAADVPGIDSQAEIDDGGIERIHQGVVLAEKKSPIVVPQLAVCIDEERR